MNLRYAAALALVGWYLMYPPIENCFGVPDGSQCKESVLADATTCVRNLRKWSGQRSIHSLRVCADRCAGAQADWRAHVAPCAMLTTAF
jgi:hypothetical protein